MFWKKTYHQENNWESQQQGFYTCLQVLLSSGAEMNKVINITCIQYVSSSISHVFLFCFSFACVSNKEIKCCFSSLSGARNAIARERIACPLLTCKCWLLGLFTHCNNIAGAAIIEEDRTWMAFWKKWKLSIEENCIIKRL
jgi:hypothetical protein